MDKKPTYKLFRHDPGNCRVLYKGPKGKMFCLMETGSWGRSNVRFFFCSKDGEPDFEVQMPNKEEFDRLELPENAFGISPEFGKLGE